MLAVVVAWVPFRAESMAATQNILLAMSGLQGFVLPSSYLGYLNYFHNLGDYLLALGWKFEYPAYFPDRIGLTLIIFLFFISALLPNTQQALYRYRPALETHHGEIKRINWRWIKWRPHAMWGFISGILFVLSIITMNVQISEFLYFQF